MLNIIDLALNDPSISKWIKWVVALLLLKAPRAPVWAAFLSLNRLYRDITLSQAGGNALSAATLLAATFDNDYSPNDYFTVFAALAFAPKIPKLAFPIIFGTLLSQFLLPGSLVPPSINKYFMEPLWLNFTMSPYVQRIDLNGLAQTYVKINVALAAVTSVFDFKKIKQHIDSGFGATQAGLFVFHRSNSLTNLIVFPNLFAFFLLGSLKNFAHYFPNRKWYIGAVGALSAWLTLKIADWGVLNPLGYNGPERDVRKYLPQLMERINLYLLRLMIVTKWRQWKSGHPVVDQLRINRGELVVLLALVWYLFNAYDDAKGRLDDRAQKIRANDMFKLVGKLKN